MAQQFNCLSRKQWKNTQKTRNSSKKEKTKTRNSPKNKERKDWVVTDKQGKNTQKKQGIPQKKRKQKNKESPPKKNKERKDRVVTDLGEEDPGVFREGVFQKMPALEGQFLKEISVRFAGENHLRTQKNTKQSSAQRFLNDPFPKTPLGPIVIRTS